MFNLLNSIWPDVDFIIGENQVNCPFHGDDKASAHVNYDGEDKILFHCKVCDQGMNTVTLAANYFKTTNDQAVKVIKALKQAKLSKHEWTTYHNQFKTNKQAQDLIRVFGVTDSVMSELRLGSSGVGVSFPVFVDDALVDVRTYNPGATPKVKSIMGAVSGFVIPQEAFDQSTIILVEGEKDMAVARSHDLNAATIIGGAQSLPNKTPSWFDNRNVVILYDNDEAGRTGAKKTAHYLLSNKEISVRVKIADISGVVNNKEKGDVTDYFTEFKGTKSDLVTRVLKQAKTVTLDDVNDIETNKIKSREVKFADADKFVGEILESTVQVAAAFDSSFTIPEEATLIGNGKHDSWKFDLMKNAQDLLEIIDSGSDDNIKKIVFPDEMPNKVSITVSDKRRPVYKLVLASTTSDVTLSGAQQTEHIAYTMDKPLQAGKDYRIIYKLVPDAKRGNKSVVLVLNAVDLSAEQNSFVVDNEVKAALDVINKYSFEDLIEMAKGIINADFNPKLIKIIELTYHSSLAFNFGRSKGIKGTIDSIIVTDTGFGKSVTSTGLLRMYERGARASLAGTAATATGLIGGSKAVGNGYQTTAGLIPRNHKGMVIFEELAKNNGTIMKDLTDIRTSGVAEITRVSGKITLPANVRMAFFSNPKAGTDGINKTVDSYPNGVEIINDLLGAKEDVGRFDLIGVLGQRESKEINPLWTPREPLAKEIYQRRLDWIWTRTADEIHISDDVGTYLVSEASQKLNEKYESDEQIFGRKTWMKLAKVAIAIAGYVGSHTEDYKGILVKKEHVDKAVEIFTELYGSETFRLDAYVAEERSYTRPDEASTAILERIYNGYNQIIDQLKDRSEIQTNELKTVAGMNADDFNTVVSDLTRAKLIRNIKGKILPTEKFRKTLPSVVGKLPQFVPTALEERIGK